MCEHTLFGFIVNILQLKCYSNFVFLGLIFVFIFGHESKIDTTANQPCTLIHVRQTHELNHHIYLLHVYCVSRNIDFFSSQTFLCIYTDYIFLWASLHAVIIHQFYEAQNVPKLKFMIINDMIYTPIIFHIYMHVLIQGITTTERNSMNLYTKINRFIFWWGIGLRYCFRILFGLIFAFA